MAFVNHALIPEGPKPALTGKLSRLDVDAAFGQQKPKNNTFPFQKPRRTKQIGKTLLRSPNSTKQKQNSNDLKSRRRLPGAG